MNLTILIVILIGFYIYYSLAINKQKNDIAEFFLAGRNIGKSLFMNSNWSNSLGFGNSMFVAIWAGYSWGLAGIWVQGIWAIGMILYGRLIPYILVHTGRHTLHGYLGSAFGGKVKNVAAFVSIVGLLFCIGFELTFSGEFFAAILGNPQNGAITVVLFALLISTFCSIGGYKGNVAVDRICNIFASLSMLAFLFALIINRPEGLSTIAKMNLGTIARQFIVPNISICEFTGFAIFTLFQIIDMTNWQTVSANSLPENEEDYPDHIIKTRKAIYRSAILFMFFPAIIGTLIGYYFHVITYEAVSQPKLLIQSVTAAMPQAIYIKTILLSGLLFGFLSSSLACTNSWLLASIQTISWDWIDFKLFNSVGFKVSELSDETHKKVIDRAKVVIYVVGAGGTALIYYISRIWDAFFSLQFMMFGAGLAMLPSFLYIVYYKRTDIRQAAVIGWGSFWSILLGFVTAAIMFTYSVVLDNSNISGLIPPSVLFISSLVFGVSLQIQKTFKKNHELQV